MRDERALLMLHRRFRTTAVAVALACVAVSAAIGATIPSTGAATAAAIALTTTAGTSTPIPVAAASGLPADLATFTVTTAGIGTLTAAGGQVTYTAPTSIPASALAGPARSAGTPSAATITREARPNIIVTPPAEDEAPTPEPTTPATDAPAHPTPAPTDTPSAEPTSTPTPTPETDEPTTPPATPPASDEATDENEAPAPLLGTGDGAPRVGDRITYTVCTAERASCTNGALTVTFAPTLLAPASVTPVTAEPGQSVTFGADSSVQNPAAADPSSVTATALRGSVNTTGGTITYTAPATVGPDSIRTTTCSLGDPNACVTVIRHVSVIPAFTTAETTSATVITGEDGTVTVPVPTRSDSGPLNPATLTVTKQTKNATVTATGSLFTIRLHDPTYTGSDAFTWRACSAANTSNCRTSILQLHVNDGFGWATTDRSVVAGLTDDLDARTLAADPDRWGLELRSVTVTGPHDVAVVADIPGVFRIKTSANRDDPFTLRICGAGRNHVQICDTVRYTVHPLNLVPKQVLPTRDREPLLSRQPVTQHTLTTAPTVRAAVPKPAPKPVVKQAGGVDITWWVIGAAMLFGIGGGAGVIRGRH